MRLALLSFCIALVAAGGGALFRLRGDKAFAARTGRGVGTMRWVWAIYLGAWAWVMDDGRAFDWSAGLYLALIEPEAWASSHPLPTLALALILALYAGATPGWWGSLDLGTHEGTLARDLPMHSLRGLVWTGPAAALLWLAGLGTPWPLLAVGALCGPIYLVALRLWPWRAVERGEWIFGTGCGLALLAGVAFA